MIAPVHRLKKRQIEWLANNKCKHRHPYLNHYECYLRDNPEQERIGFFDIETTHLKSNFGVVLSYAICDSNRDVIGEYITRKDILNFAVRDRNILKRLIEDLQGFDKLVTYYGTRFDLPFVRTRALIHGLPFPKYAGKRHKDLYYTIRNRFSLHSNRLEVACQTLLGRTHKTHMIPMVWQKASVGDKEALRYVWEHNVADVVDLRDLYYATIEYGFPGDRSI